MKVKIKDLEPNPFRDMKNYPIDSRKIESLTNSINQTGFWDNILARKKDGKIQIAYGHHRLIVLQRNFKPDHIIDISIRDLDDPTMIKIMANENMEQWELNPAVIDETVKTTQEFLFKHQDIVRKLDTSTLRETRALDKSSDIGVRIITRFLGENWKMDWVSDALLRLRLKNEDILDKEAIDSMPSRRAAKDFVKAVQKTKVTPEIQKKVARKIVESREKESEDRAIYGKQAMAAELLEEKLGFSAKEKKEKEFSIYIGECSNLIRTLNRRLDVLIDFKSDFDSKYYKNTFARFEFDGLINMLQIKLKKLMEAKK